MIDEVEDRIRVRAHALWEREGRPADRADAHWFQAAAEVIARKSPRTAAKTKVARVAATEPAKAPKSRGKTRVLETTS